MNQKLATQLTAEGVKEEQVLQAALQRLTARVHDGFPVSAAIRLVAKTEEQAKKMDSCVDDILAKKDFEPKKGRTRKESAYAICTNQILGSRGFSHLGFLRQVAAEMGGEATPEAQAAAILKDLRNPDSVAYKSYLTPDKKELDQKKVMDDLTTFYVLTPQEAKLVLQNLVQGWAQLKQKSTEISREYKAPARQQDKNKQEYNQEVGRPTTSAQDPNAPAFAYMDGVMVPVNMGANEQDADLFAKD